MSNQRYATIALMGLSALALGAPIQAHAAFDTEVLSALEPDKPLPDVHLGVTFDRRMKQARIIREWVQDDGGTRQALDVRELTYTETVQRLLIDLRVGLFRDLELHVQAPIVLADDSEIRFADGVEGASTIFGSPNADNPASDFQFPLTTVPGSRNRAGFGDMTFGLSWSPLVDTKDPGFPTVTLRTDVIAPTGPIRDPKDQRALPNTDGTGDVGLGQLQFDISLALSKRMGVEAPYLDPYVVLGARIPVAVGEQRDRGLEPPVSGRLRLGTAVVIAERKDHERYAVDLRFGMRYVASGRTYSELSDYLPDFDQTSIGGSPTYIDYADPANYAEQLDGARCGTVEGIPCGELNQVDDHLVLSSALAIMIQPSRWVRFRFGVDASFTTTHVLTGERLGTDQDPASAAGQMCGSTPCVGRINAENSQGVDERSRFYDPRYDEVGRRLIADDILSLRVFVTTFITF